ncbi:MAG: YitT family protein [Chitinophagaceae bacterium]|nr:YitT family protein [Chitinophagaceae bacterium]
MQFEKAYSFIIQKLEQELPKHLTYHNVKHTKEVVQMVQQLAKAEKVPQHDLQTLQTAALFHDTGFTKTYEDHEEASCEIAKELLPQFNYTTNEIEQICELIRATKLSYVPGNHLEKILRDADLAYLGTDEYFAVGERLFLEFKEVGIVKSWEEWPRLQINFLEGHQYHTAAARRRFTEKKSQNLLVVKSGHMKTAGLKKKQRAHTIQDFGLIAIGTLSAGFALKGFLVPNHFFDGGVTGISLLIHELFHIDLSLVILVLNLPFIIMGYKIVTRSFAIKTLVAILLYSILLLYFPYSTITSDKLLISIFGGFFLGLGGGLIMRAGCALDGIEVLALYTWKKTSFTITEIIMAINVVIFSIAAFRFGIPTALYSILTYFTATRTIDYVAEGFEAYTGVTIISGQSELIKNRLVNELGRSITVYKGERGYLPGKFDMISETDIIFTVITRLELRKLKNLVNETDPHAFVFASTIKEASGGILKRRHAH